MDGVGLRVRKDAEEECDEEGVGGDVEVEVDRGVRDERSYAGEGADEQGEFVALHAVGGFELSPHDTTHARDAGVDVSAEEDYAEAGSDKAVFSEEFEIVVVGMDRIVLHLLRPELPPVIDVGARSRADDRLEVELLQRGLPEKDAHIRRIIDLTESHADGVARLHHGQSAADQDGKPYDAGHEHGQEKVPPKPADRPEADDGEGEQTERSAQPAAAAPGYGDPRETYGKGVTGQHPQGIPASPPAAEAQRDKPEHFQKTREMVRADVETARPPPVVRTVNPGQQHVVVASGELEDTHDHMHHRIGEQDRNERVTPTRARHVDSAHEVGDESAEGHEEVVARLVFDRREVGTHADVKREGNRAHQAKQAGPSLISVRPGREHEETAHCKEGVGRESINQLRTANQGLDGSECEGKEGNDERGHRELDLANAWLVRRNKVRN